MASTILIVDDDETFRESTADLLRIEGYECHTAQAAATARNMLAEADRFDLLVSDIHMPGNENLELLRRISEDRLVVPSILVTGYPSLATAIDSVTLEVVAYIVKPFVLDELLGAVRRGLRRSRTLRAIRHAGGHLKELCDELREIESAPPRCDEGLTLARSAFLDLTIGTIHRSVLDLKALAEEEEAADRDGADRSPCHLLHCPQTAPVLQALRETIDVLEKTKTAFRSKDLADLRRKLERLLRDEQAAA